MAHWGHVPKHDDRELSRLAVWKAVRGAAEPEAGAGRRRDFPLGLRFAGRSRGYPAAGVNSHDAPHRVRQAMAAAVRWATVIAGWNQIAEALGEPNRNRKPRLQRLFYLSAYGPAAGRYADNRVSCWWSRYLSVMPAM